MIFYLMILNSGGSFDPGPTGIFLIDRLSSILSTTQGTLMLMLGAALISFVIFEGIHAVGVYRRNAASRNIG